MNIIDNYNKNKEPTPWTSLRSAYDKQIEDDGSFYTICDYTPLIESFNFEILLMEEEDDYQGDSYFLFEDNKHRIGYLNFGWGSCSGCDALQACNSVKEIEELRQELFDSIIWFDNKEEAIDYMLHHDWEGDYSGRSQTARTFRQKAINIMEGESLERYL